MEKPINGFPSFLRKRKSQAMEIVQGNVGLGEKTGVGGGENVGLGLLGGEMAGKFHGGFVHGVENKDGFGGGNVGFVGLGSKDEMGREFHHGGFGGGGNKDADVVVEERVDFGGLGLGGENARKSHGGGGGGENVDFVGLGVGVGMTKKSHGGASGGGEGKSMGAMVVVEKKRDGNMDRPPDDDCCPICFGNFDIACKTNCGHWFCANCILQFWNYRAVLQKCKCPICLRLISKLTPEASLLIRQEGEVIETLEKVQRYNRLFQGGIYGLARKISEFPCVMKKMLGGLMDPDRFRANYYAVRFFALILSCLYSISPFDFLQAGPLETRRLFDACAIFLVVILCLLGLLRRCILRRRVRRLAAAQP